ncbi:hypothetical protein D3C77_393560 [compost metagenome]
MHNNPLIYTDPSGHKIWLIHGTNLKIRENPEATWTPEFIEYIGGLYNEDVATPRWSGGKQEIISLLERRLLKLYPRIY